MANGIPDVDFCGVSLSRLLVGGNPISGFSHVSARMDGDMEDYFTQENAKRLLFDCERAGITGMSLRCDKHILRLIREYRAEGGTLQWIAQTAPELKAFEANLGMMKKYRPAMAYHHGVMLDELFLAGDTAQILKNLDALRRLEIPVGVCTHLPEVVRYSREHGWNPDFYMCCLYAVSRPARVAASKAAGNEDALFEDGDPARMLGEIAETDKPCIAFKILGASRRCDTQEDVYRAFQTAYARIKPGDIAAVGMYPRDVDQVRLNREYVIRATARA